ncbi:MAG: phosphatidylserine/phosphatidylglycerophosphate/cardiolipin synthase family protein [Candidatus Hadarchaeales archaeon]
MRRYLFTLGALFAVSLAISGGIHIATSVQYIQYNFLGSATLRDNIFAEIIEVAPPALDHPDIRNIPDVIKEEVANAKFSLDMEVFSWYWYSSGPVAQISNAIREAASRGVRVRILMDNEMYREAIKGDAEKFLFQSMDNHPNIEIRQSRLPMHSKVFIIDNATVIVSSANLSNSAMTESRNIGVLVKGEIFGRAMTNIFEAGWSRNIPPSEFENGWPISWIKPVATPLDCPSWVPTTLETVVYLFKTAKNTVNVPTYVMSPPSALKNAVENAAERGAFVRIIVDSEFGDPNEFPDIKTLDELPRVEIKRAELPGNGVYHSKTIVVDGKAGYVGSANWSASSMIGRRELGVYFEDENLASAVEEIFRRDWSSKYVKYILPQPDKITEFLVRAGIIFGILLIGVILFQESRRRKSIERRKKWVAELWGSVLTEI